MRAPPPDAAPPDTVRPDAAAQPTGATPAAPASRAVPPASAASAAAAPSAPPHGGRLRRWRDWRAARLGFSTGNRLRLFSTGSAYFAALIQRIDAAQRTVSLETYMFCDDDAAHPVSVALMRAAQRGVTVQVITDGVGTGRLAIFNDWRHAGIQHYIYNPHLFGRLGFSRTHRKIAAIDDAVCFVGGINIVDDLMAGDHRLVAPRWDFALEIVGPLVADVARAFRLQWRRLDGYRGLTLPATRWRQRVAGGRYAGYGAPHNEAGEPQAAFVARDNLRNRRAIEKAYLFAIGRARHEIILANPYFVPGRKLRRALVFAARRGIDVRLLVGRKEFVLLDYAVPSLYHSLLKAGVRIAEYDKTMLHGKVAVVDGSWATVGSSNLDALSLLVNHEANVVFVEYPEITALRGAILDAFDESRQIDQNTFSARPRVERVLNWLAYAGYRFAMKLLTVGRYD